VPDIRFAKPGDGEGIFSLIHELAVFEKLESEVVGSSGKLEEHLFSQNPACEALVAIEDSVIIAYALFFGTYSTFLTQAGMYLEDLYVTPAWRGRGVGKALLARLALTTVQRGGGRLEWSVLDWNRAAIGFYESVGAYAQSEWTMFRLTEKALEDLAATSE
jgi:GNAT superfamily N-acetyltransferase